MASTSEIRNMNHILDEGNRTDQYEINNYPEIYRIMKKKIPRDAQKYQGREKGTIQLKEMEKIISLEKL